MMHGTVKRVLTHSPTAVFFFFSFSFSFLSFLSFFFLGGSAAKNVGFPQLLDAIVNLLPAPAERGAEKAIDILQKEIDRTLALLGRPTLADLDRSAIRMRMGC